MRTRHYVILGLIIIGSLYVYHNFVANKGSLKSGLAGIGINR